MKLRSRVTWLAAAVGLGSVAAVVAFGAWRVSRTLRLAREQVRAGHELHLIMRSYDPAPTGFEPISAPAVYAQAVQFQDHFFIAGPSGLLEYDANGALLKQYAPGRDLPSSPLVALATGSLADAHEPELLMATADDGLLMFNGHSFRQVRPEDANSTTITSILPTAAGHLLIGTKKRGVLLYDGKQLVALHPTLSDLYITTLAGSESDLWAGTLSHGVAHWHAGETDWFEEQDGLPDPQVLSIAVAGEKAFVGTAMGIASFDGGRFSRVLAPGIFANTLLVRQGQLFVGTEDQGVLEFELEARSREAIGSWSNRRDQPPNLENVRQIFLAEESVLALAQNGLYRREKRGTAWRPVLRPDRTLLADRNISALSADANGQLWVGYFDRGLDIVESDGARSRHIEDEHIFCVNRILRDPQSGNTNVATANGLARFDAEGNQQQLLTRADGLIADHITDVALYRGGLALATPAGLTFLDASGVHSIYAFHGLANNHVYALGVSGDELLAGTLGGLSVLEKDTVELNYTTASGLAHNWITAVVPVGDGWMVGTYGAGVLGLDHSGHFHRFDQASAGYEVNPNAMLVTPHHVFAGSLARGLYVYERDSSRWFAITRGLPSLNVTALTLSNGYLYIGTDNGLVRIREQELHP